MKKTLLKEYILKLGRQGVLGFAWKFYSSNTSSLFKKTNRTIMESSLFNKQSLFQDIQTCTYRLFVVRLLKSQISNKISLEITYLTALGDLNKLLEIWVLLKPYKYWIRLVHGILDHVSSLLVFDNTSRTCLDFNEINNSILIY